MALFNHRELKAQNFLQKIFKKSPKANFPIELENLFADYENSLESLSISQVNEIASKYKIDLTRDFMDERLDLLNRMLDRALIDGCIDDGEYRLLRHFSALMELGDKVLENEIKEKATDIYRKKLETIFSDAYISENEKCELEQLKSKLRLPDDVAVNLYREAVKSTMDSYTKPIFESELFSPEDEERMHHAAKNLGLSLSFPPDIQEKLSKYRLNWEIVNGKLPVLKSDIHLQSGEILHHVQRINWLEERSETKKVNYSGFTYSTKIIGGLRWKSGSIRSNRITEKVWKLIDSGQILLTSKRIIFTGEHGNKFIPYSKVLHFEVYSNGIQIQKDSGKSPFLEFSEEIPMFAEILNQLLGRN